MPLELALTLVKFVHHDSPSRPVLMHIHVSFQNHSAYTIREHGCESRPESRAVGPTYWTGVNDENSQPWNDDLPQ